MQVVGFGWGGEVLEAYLEKLQSHHHKPTVRVF